LEKAGAKIMLNMSVSADSKQPLKIMDDHFLSIMTTLFIEGLAIDQLKEPNTDRMMHPSHPWGSNAKASHLPLSYSKETEAIALKEYGTRKAEPRNMKRKARGEDANKTIRTFILGLSDAFNNLLMGILGNFSLINLAIGKANPIFQYVLEMEQLIQNGSALTNGIFGYLGERRIVASNIRLNRLIQEISESISIDDVRIKEEIIQASHISPASQNNAPIIAASLARMLSHLMEQIQQQYHLIIKERILDEVIQNRLNTVERLINRAWKIITLLECYTGMCEFNIQTISIKTLAKRLARQCGKNNPHLKISLDMAQKLPRVHADRSMLQFVLNQIMENAAITMPNQGNLHVSVRTLNSEKPYNRCVAYRWVDSIVVTVADTGYGMDLKTLLHIFDPFYSGRRNSSSLGMGLAASWGIIKAHNGYIHVRSKTGEGSTFKIYLPIS
jgi:signal transduction histidine kinase